MQNLFVYGTLRHPDVWLAIVRRPCRSQPAILEGYAALRVRNENYPGLIRMDDHQVEGLVYFDISEEDLECLDRFEGSEYVRIGVSPKLLHVETSVIAQTYLFKPECQDLLEPVPWNYDEFVHAGIQRFPS